MEKYNNENASRLIIQSVEHMIEQYNMLDNCENVIVGLSGGADSVCLLLVLKDYIERKALQIKLEAIHVNHGIRGDEAARDEHFAKQLCDRLNIGFRCENVDIPALARDNKQTEEEAGRNARYAIFARRAEQLKNAKVAVAHHMNDQAETVLMNMLRGSSLRGLCGIFPVRGNIIRPLLSTTRAEVEEYLKTAGQNYMTDATNEDTGYTRNRVRRTVIPFLEDKINPQTVKRLAELADSVQETESYIRRQSDKAYEQCITEIDAGVEIAAEKFMELDRVIGKNVIHKAIVTLSKAEKDIYKSNIEDVYELFTQQVDKKRSLPYKLYAKRSYDSVQLCHVEVEKEDEISDISIDVSGVVGMLDVGVPIRIPVEHMIYTERDGMVYISDVVLELQENIEFSDNNDYTKIFDYDKMENNLIFRFRRTGDRIVVTSDGQSRKLKKEFIDRKIPKELRNQIMLLASDSEVYWAMGVRRSESCLVEPATEHILRVTFE